MSSLLKPGFIPLSKSLYHPQPVAWLYRKVLRSIPRVIITYDLDITEKTAQKQVQKMFRKHKEPLDPRVLDRLLQKGEQDLVETLEQWNQKTHMDRLLSGQ